MNKNSAIYKALLLGIICTVCGLLLGVVNSITAPIIQQNSIAAVESSLKEIFPDGSFTDVTDQYISQDKTGLIDGIYEAKDQGYVFTLHNNGYGGEFSFIIGYNSDGTIAGYKGLENNETPGKGTLAFEDDYIDEVLALTSSDPMPIITGSTVTTVAVDEACGAAKAIFNSIMGIEYDPNAKAEAPVEETGGTLGQEDLSKYKAECSEVSNDGKVAVYACKADGFNKGNEANITVDVENHSITAIEFTNFADDGDKIGDELADQSELEKYVGITVDDTIDAVSGATMTSNAIKAMIKEALIASGAEVQEAASGLRGEDLSKQKAECSEESNDGTIAVYACKAKGFNPGNEARITIDIATKTVSAMEVTNFADDGDKIGDELADQSELEKYYGKTLDEDMDAVSGATMTSNAFKAMIQAALLAIEG